MSRYNLAHKLVRMRQASNEDSGCKKPQLTKSGKNYRTFQHGKRRKSKEKKEVIEQAQKKGRVVHLAALMDMFYLKNEELQAKFQRHKGRVVLRGEVVQDD